jgi:hypothetical protein
MANRTRWPSQGSTGRQHEQSAFLRLSNGFSSAGDSHRSKETRQHRVDFGQSNAKRGGHFVRRAAVGQQLECLPLARRDQESTRRSPSLFCQHHNSLSSAWFADRPESPRSYLLTRQVSGFPARLKNWSERRRLPSVRPFTAGHVVRARATMKRDGVVHPDLDNKARWPW